MEAMFFGILIFGIAAIILVVGYVSMTSRHHEYEKTLPPEDQLTDAQFRKIEFGDDE